ncbi:MAG: 2,3-dehydroadipyl-CoA hydratase [Syntrophorhabdus sp. PtaU1.Bin058]|nr:MAG: 2,3-dehydroadipyl-CoA hydratase [Syntrophorhabdus sp. PtaU1.Bin058]
MIEYTRDGRIAIFRINRPEAMGAITVEGMRQLNNALINFRDDDELWVGIITGTGNEVFCAGMDVKEFLPFIGDTKHMKWRRQDGVIRGMDLWKPMIAACNGLTLGGGLEISLACDIMIASENAVFGLPEVKVGVVPGGGGTTRLPRTIPRRLAAEMLFTGKTIKAQEAYRIGLVNKVVPSDQLMEEAKKMAQAICEAAPLAVRYVKELMVRGEGMAIEEALRLEDDIESTLMATKDFSEGITAFAEKRRPNFEGR